MVEMIFLAALLLFLGLAGWKIERDVDRKVRRIQKKCKAKEPRLKEREDYWAALGGIRRKINELDKSI